MNIITTKTAPALENMTRQYILVTVKCGIGEYFFATDKFVGNKFEHQRFLADGPKGGGQEARNNSQSTQR